MNDTEFFQAVLLIVLIQYAVYLLGRVYDAYYTTSAPPPFTGGGGVR